MWPRLRRADQRRTAHSRAVVACQWVDDLRRWEGFADSGKQVVPAVPGAVQLDLDPAPTQVERVTCEADDVDAVHDRRGLGDFFSRSRLEAGETVHRDDSDAVTPSPGLGRQPGLEDLFQTLFDHRQPPAPTRPSYVSNVSECIPNDRQF